MAILTINDKYLSDIADAIREKSKSEDKYKPREMAVAILAIEDVENDPVTTVDTIDSLITRELSGDYTNDRVTSIGEYAFKGCNELTSVTFPNATSIGAYAFNNCDGLTSVSFPSVTSIDSEAFGACDKLSEISFPNISSIGKNAFSNCFSLTTLNLNVQSIGEIAFAACDGLREVTLPNVTRINSGAFGGCYNLTKVTIPGVYDNGSSRLIQIAADAFMGCESLTDIYVFWPEDHDYFNTNAPWGATNATIHYNYTGE